MMTVFMSSEELQVRLQQNHIDALGAIKKFQPQLHTLLLG
jgi:hypothetical protein